jgi:hypothetical protein
MGVLALDLVLLVGRPAVGVVVAVVAVMVRRGLVLGTMAVAVVVTVMGVAAPGVLRATAHALVALALVVMLDPVVGLAVVLAMVGLVQHDLAAVGALLGLLLRPAVAIFLRLGLQVLFGLVDPAGRLVVAMVAMVGVASARMLDPLVFAPFVFLTAFVVYGHRGTSF